MNSADSKRSKCETISERIIFSFVKYLLYMLILKTFINEVWVGHYVSMPVVFYNDFYVVIFADSKREIRT